MTTANLSDVGLLRLLQLCSPALPIGMFAYSQGLEHAVEIGAVSDEESAAAWILGLMSHSLRAVDVPVLARLHAAWGDGDPAVVRRWNDLLWASRGARELQDEDQRLGNALARVLTGLGVDRAEPWVADPRATYANLFALAAASWGVPARAAGCHPPDPARTICQPANSVSRAGGDPRRRRRRPVAAGRRHRLFGARARDRLRVARDAVLAPLSLMNNC